MRYPVSTEATYQNSRVDGVIVTAGARQVATKTADSSKKGSCFCSCGGQAGA